MSGKKIVLSSITCILIIGLTGGCQADSQPVRIVDGGRPRAVVVTVAEPCGNTETAVRELVEHVRKATGVELPVVSEDAIPGDYEHRLFLGDTEAARRQGIDSKALFDQEVYENQIFQDIRSEDYVRETSSIVTAGGDLYIAGHSLYGVYEFLDRFLGVRWLWPGDLGVYVPRTGSVVVNGGIEQTIEPSLFKRSIRRGAVGGAARQEVDVFASRHRMGGPYLLGRGHFFGNWWNRYGDDHPEWFRADETGERVGRTMCVSNPELHQFLLEHQSDRIVNQGVLGLGESDHWDLCQCDTCRAWDGPQPETVPAFAKRACYPQTASNRYVRFWKKMYDMAVEKNPEVAVGAFIYQRYTTVPTIDIELNRNFFLEFVQWGDPNFDSFPVTDDAFSWLQDQWLGWKETGASMIYRPNILLRGYAMPYVNMRQMGEFFQFAYENGMLGTDFDSLTPMWSVRGPELYLLYRLHWKPEMDIEAILDEYYSGFGPAAELVREYFDYWEQHIAELVDAGYDNWRKFSSEHEPDLTFANYADFYRLDRNRLNIAHQLFPLDSYEPAEAILEQAAAQAAEANNTEYVQRVEFLRLGLEHARHCTRLAAVYDGDPTYSRIELEPGTEEFDKAREIYQEILEFRETHRGKHLMGIEQLATYEKTSWWNIEDLLEE